MGKRHDPRDLKWWEEKLIDKVDGRAFSHSVGRHAYKVLVSLVENPVGKVSSNSFPSGIAKELEVPKKYLSRSLGLLARYKLLKLYQDSNFLTIMLLSDSEAKDLKQYRRRPSKTWRKSFFDIEGYRCGHCKKKFPYSSLRIDHIVPLSMMGADSISNWGALCASCNGTKLHDFDRTWLRLYRNKKVEDTVGVRFIDGAFWPVINGRTRIESSKAKKLSVKD